MFAGRLLPRYASTAAAPVAHKQTHEQSDEHWRDSRFLFGAALVGTLGTAFAGGLIASAKVQLNLLIIYDHSLLYNRSFKQRGGRASPFYIEPLVTTVLN